MTTQSYRELMVWRKGIDLVKQVYVLTERFPKQETYGLANQLQRAATSVPSNIAEGEARGRTKDFVRFLRMAIGSLAEVDTQLEIAKELSYVTEDNIKPLNELALETRKMLFGLIKRVANN